MKRFSFPCFPLLSGLFVLSVAWSSCAVFEFVGNSLSQAYDNTVSYFNSYYNAKKIFEEAEAEARSASLAARAKVDLLTAAPTVPQSAYQKFTTVIEKSSAILSLYPKSALVDHAVFIIGKSYYYQAEYLKAERKFSELLAQFSASSFRFQAQLWLAKTYSRLSRFSDATKVGERLAADALEQKEKEIAAEAYALLGSIYETQKAPERAIEYYAKAVETADDDFLKATIETKLGDLRYADGEFDKAVLAYLKVIDANADTYLNSYSRLQAARAYSALEKYDTALFFTNELVNDIRYSEYAAVARLERARILAESGRVNEAIDEYRSLDTTYARTEIGGKAAYDLARLYEARLGNYPEAGRYYEKAGSNPFPEVAALAQRKEAALNRYLFLRQNLALGDSLLGKTNALTSRADTLSRGSDSLKAAVVRVNPDSIKGLRANIAYELGEIFYSDVEQPDSAFYWFHQALALKRDSVRTPRALYILVALIKANPEKNFGDADSVMQTLTEQYPNSQYAPNSKKISSQQLVPQTVDVAERSYAVAESLIESQNYEKAITKLRQIIRDNPNSPLAAKSQYAIGWVYEHRLFKPESALVQYKGLVEHYSMSPYASVVKNRLTEGSGGSKIDSGSTIPNQPKLTPAKVDSTKSLDESVARLRPTFQGQDTTKSRRRIIKE